MKIAFDHQIFSTQAYGGISRYFTRLIEQLLLSKEQTKVFAPMHRNQYLRELPSSSVAGYHIPLYFPGISRLMRNTNPILAQGRLRNWKPDIIHETYYSCMGHCPRGCQTILTVYDMIHEKFGQYFKPEDPTSRRKRAAVERAAHIICISQNTKNDLLDLFDVDDKKVSVVHLGFEVSTYAKKDNVIGVHDELPYLLYVGDRRGYKNFFGFLAAFSSSKFLRNSFCIIAFGGGKFTFEEHQLIKDVGLEDNRIRQIGGDDNVLCILYENASAFIYPSIYEGFGLPPLEAMSHHCPVVSSNSSSMPEVIGNAAEFFDPVSQESMVEAMERVLMSPSRTSELVELGLKRLRSFSWQQCADETLDIYRKVAE